MSPGRLGTCLAILVFVADQAVKAWVLFGLRLPERPPIRLGPVDLVMVWNRGISYGLFQQHQNWGRWGLVALSVAAAIGLGAWLARTGSLIVGAATGLLIGGALGNALDRVVHGAVADFVLLYWIPFFPYVFNLADSAIVAGVALLLYDSLILEPGRRTASAAGSDAPAADGRP